MVASPKAHRAADLEQHAEQWREKAQKLSYENAIFGATHLTLAEVVEAFQLLADALEAKERADNEAKQARQAEAAAYADAEIAESRLKEAMRVMVPLALPDTTYVRRVGGIGKWQCTQPSETAWENWCTEANKFERAFGVKVEECKP